MALTVTNPNTIAKATTPAVASATGHTMETNPPKPKPRRTNQMEFITTAIKVTIAAVIPSQRKTRHLPRPRGQANGQLQRQASGAGCIAPLPSRIE